MTNKKRAQAIYKALEKKEFDLDPDGFRAVIAATLDATEPPATAAPVMLALLTEGIGIPDSADFASDLEIIARFLKAYHPLASNDLRVKAQAIRAAISASHPLGAKSLEGIAAAKGE